MALYTNKPDKAFVNIPIRYEFRPEPMRWSVVEVEVIGWLETIQRRERVLEEARKRAAGELFFPALALGLGSILAAPLGTQDGVLWNMACIRICGTEKTFRMRQEDFPKGLVPRSATPANTPDLEADTFTMLVGASSKKGTGPMRDPWEMRDEFIGLDPGSLPGLVEFLHKWGSWGGSTHGSAFWIFRDSDDYLDRDNRTLMGLLPEKAWAYREQIRDALINVKDDWLAKAPSLFSRSMTEAQLPWYSISEAQCAEALGHTVTIDKLKRVEHYICARPGCGKIVVQKTKHKKKFHDEKCASRVRQSRFNNAKATSIKRAKKSTARIAS